MYRTCFGLLLMTQAVASQSPTATPCGLNDSARALAELIITHRSQQRSELKCDQTLVGLAQQRARALLEGTADEAITPNQVLVNGGYRFATFYPPTGNQVEAVAKNQQDPQAAMRYFVDGNKHHDHVLGYGEFFSRQQDLGVGFAENEAGHSQFVVFIAEPYQSPKIVYKQTFQPPKLVNQAKCPKNWRHSNDEQVRRVCKKQQQQEQQQQDQ